ncbi:hypothetical protein RJ640_030458 [Escallonia rubra]|uniref:Subtilisin-like protease SBT1.9 n=1 Tax=Escallonia rubra TaxID=112253 RepID=A0AA88QFW0_9ASTE|nr:hypothetical protein RJ640_030458 [Escallonia rubra]
MAALPILMLSLLIFSLPLTASPTILPATYIIHMNSSAMPMVFTSHHSWYSAALSSVMHAKTTSSHIYTYNNVLHGFCASFYPFELDTLQDLPGYVSHTRDLPVTMHTTHTSQFIGLNTVSGAWPASNYGRDVIIGLVDTGIWPESTSFSDNGMMEIPARWKGKCTEGSEFSSSSCNKKLIGARFYNKGLLSNKPNTTILMNSARDTDGHGTHTSSTAAGNYVDGASFFGYAPGTARGMAPMAHVAVYKVVWDSGGYASDVLAAIDQAIDDGVDVLSLSIGLDGIPLYEDPVAIAAFAAMEKGIFVASSAGNAGPWYKTLHNGIPWLLNVAAGTVDRDFSGKLTFGNGLSVLGTSLYHGNASLSQVSLVFMGECDDLQGRQQQVRNHIIVCEDKSDSLAIQVNDAASVRVAGGIFISNSSSVQFFVKSAFPAVFVSPKESRVILNYIKGSSEPRASMEFEQTVVGTKPAPRVASYSSRGPSPSCPSILKPDLMAPGSMVLASWPQIKSVSTDESKDSSSKFNIISGTSMACPHVAGVAALLRGAHPEWSPAAIRSAMMTTASPVDNVFEPIKDYGDDNIPASPLAMGAGHVDPNKALDPGLIYDATVEDYVGLLCELKYTKKQIQMIRRSYTSYNCSNATVNLNYPSFIAFFNASDTSSDTVVKEFQRTVTNVGRGASSYTVNLAPMSGFEVEVEPERIVFKEKYESRSYKLTLKGPSSMKELVVHGSLSWTDSDGKHVVRSPIVATKISSKPLT